jgi:hypothetical protein
MAVARVTAGHRERTQALDTKGSCDHTRGMPQSFIASISALAIGTRLSRMRHHRAHSGVDNDVEHDGRQRHATGRRQVHVQHGGPRGGPGDAQGLGGGAWRPA